MNPSVLAAVAVGTLIMSTATFFALRLIARQQKQTARLLDSLATGLGATRKGNVVSGEKDGSPFTLAYHPGGKNVPARFVVNLTQPFIGTVRVVREDQAHRLAKHLGLNREHQTHDPDFDAEFYLEAPNPRLVAYLFDIPRRRQDVRTIFAASAKMSALTVDPNGVACILQPFDINDESVNVAMVATLLEAMKSFGAPLPYNAELGSYVPEVSRFLGWSKALVTGSIVSVALGVTALVWGALAYPPMDRGIYLAPLPLAGLLLAAGWYALFTVLKGASTSSKTFTLTAVLLAVGVITLTLGGTVLYNGVMDRKPASRHIVPVTDMKVSYGDNEAYRLYFPHPFRQGKTDHIQVNQSLFDRIRVGDKLVLYTRPGALGYPWLQGYHDLRVSTDR